MEEVVEWSFDARHPARARVLLATARIAAAKGKQRTAVARYEERNPALNAVVIPMIDEARAAIDAGLPDGPLRGVPYLLKDLHLLVEGVRTTNGCRMFADHVADHDSEFVTRTKRAGLVVFGAEA